MTAKEIIGVSLLFAYIIGLLVFYIASTRKRARLDKQWREADARAATTPGLCYAQYNVPLTVVFPDGTKCYCEPESWKKAQNPFKPNPVCGG